MRAASTRLMIAALIATLTVTAAGCGSGPAAGENTGTITGQLATGAPKDLNLLEADSEDVIDQVPDGNWEKVNKDLAEMTDAWTAYRLLAVDAGATQGQVDELDAAFARLTDDIASRNGPGTEQGANDVSRIVVELFGLYEIPYPVQVGRLDVIGRQIIFDTRADDFDKATAQVEAARQAWDAMAEDIRSKSPEVADQMDAIMAALSNAATESNGEILIDQAQVLLEVVDEIESLY